jgi:hypothetical protein
MLAEPVYYCVNICETGKSRLRSGCFYDTLAPRTLLPPAYPHFSHNRTSPTPTKTRAASDARPATSRKSNPEIDPSSSGTTHSILLFLWKCQRGHSLSHFPMGAIIQQENANTTQAPSITKIGMMPSPAFGLSFIEPLAYPMPPIVNAIRGKILASISIFTR